MIKVFASFGVGLCASTGVASRILACTVDRLIGGKVLTLGLLPFFFLLVTVTEAAAQGNLPEPDVKFRFDVSEPGSSVIEKFRVVTARSYQFVVEIEYATLSEIPRILRLIGTGQRYPDGRYYAPGVVIPVELRVDQVTDGNSRNVIHDQLIPVQGVAYQNLSGATSGSYGRLIASLRLVPGIYEMHARTTTRIPDFDGMTSKLVITKDSRFIPY